MMVHVSWREMHQAFVSHRNLAEASSPGRSGSHNLLLVYAVECGLKAVIMRRRGYANIRQLPENLTSHNFRELLKEVSRRVQRRRIAPPPRLRIERTAFSQELLVVESLSDLMSKLDGTDVSKMMRVLADDWIVQSTKTLQDTPERTDLNSKRRDLETFATKLEFAESGEGEKFLTTPQLRAIAQRFQSETPLAVVIGAKGAGKTYTYFQLVREKTWSAFVRSTLKDDVGGPWGHIWPLLQPGNLKSPARKLITDCSRIACEALDLRSPPGWTQSQISDEINAILRRGRRDESLWRLDWFRLMALSFGFPGGNDHHAEKLIETLRAQNRRLILVVDGLEEQFPQIAEDQGQQVALRALLQGLPARLAEFPDCPLGLIVFVRADFVRAAIRQNIGQFERLYESFALRWDRQQALRLAVWLCSESGILDNVDPEALKVEEATELLYPVWGRKLGSDRSREARTAEYVISGLSDFKGQIQARDLVRLFRYAANFSLETPSGDRLLTPNAIRKALKPCSEQKITEIQQEIRDLEAVFEKLRKGTEKRIPFGAEEFGFTRKELELLEASGVILQDGGEYYMPEIFRLGFGFQLAGGARPRVLSLAKRAQMSRPAPLS